MYNFIIFLLLIINVCYCIILPSNPSLTGPYSVGRKIIPSITSRNFTIEIWFPISKNSTINKKPIIYDLRNHLPLDMQAKLKGNINDIGVSQPCNMLKNNPQCYESNEIFMNDTKKKRPLILFIHGTGGWRGYVYLFIYYHYYFLYTY